MPSPFLVNAMLDIAFSPCPNDTFAIDAWVNKKIPSTLLPNLYLLDIEELNQAALKRHYPITKISCFTFAMLTDFYTMLPVGAALGYGLGPKLVSKSEHDLANLHQMTIAHPGEHTTAYALLKITLPEATKLVPLCYNKIISAIEREEVDAGVIIHESRFTFQDAHLKELADLGNLYEKEFHCPIPLGVVAALKTIDIDTVNEVVKSLKESLLYAKNNRGEESAFIRKHALEESAISKHINLYVTEDTYTITNEGTRAIAQFIQLTKERKLLPALNHI